MDARIFMTYAIGARKEFLRQIRDILNELSNPDISIKHARAQRLKKCLEYIALLKEKEHSTLVTSEEKS